MNIVSIRSVRGPNIYHHLPVLVMRVDLGTWRETASNEVPRFKERLLTLLPGIAQHTCSKGYEGGFLERLNTGTYPAHIIEHVALELSRLAGIEVKYGKTRYCGNGNLYDIAVRYECRDAMVESLVSGVEVVKGALANSKIPDIKKIVKSVRSTFQSKNIGPSTLALINAAQERGIPFRNLFDDGSIYQLGYGKYLRYISAAVTDRTSLISSDLVQDKYLTKEILSRYGIPVPKGLLVRDESELKKASELVGFPLVLKPFNGNHGRGVFTNIKNYEALISCFNSIKKFCDTVILEEMCHGKDYRVLIVGGKLSAASERIPPFVLGDGKATILELIERLNSDPRRYPGHGGVLTKVDIDGPLIHTLTNFAYSLNSIPLKDARVELRNSGNLSTGGSSIDVTDNVHPSIKSLCERISRLLRLDICGVDIIHHNIMTEIDSSFHIIELNVAPGLRMHLQPSMGTPREVGREILTMLYPPGVPSRIPIISITGTNGKTTTARLMAKVFSQQMCVGLTTSDGIWIGSDCVQRGDTTGPLSSESVLSDPAVECAVLEVARGGILRSGLGYDWSDCSIITNIRRDHIGQDGIETLDDLVWIKSLVAERVKEGGHLVLNADDSESLGLHRNPRIRKLRKNLFFYSLDKANLENYRKYNACWVESNWIHTKYAGKSTRLINVCDIPLTLGGHAKFQVSNTLAAVSACTAMGVPAEQIRCALMSFEPLKENPGRLSLFEVEGKYILLDYGHNPDAIAEIGRVLSEWCKQRKLAVIGLPGDRSNDVYCEAADNVSKYFDRVIIREDEDLRGRREGEVPAIIAEQLSKWKTQYSIELDSIAAIDLALSEAGVDEVIAVFYEKLEPIASFLAARNAKPVYGLPRFKRNSVMEKGA